MATTKKKASPAQIAARKRFAEMAKSGAFKGRRKKSASKKARRTSKAVPSPAQLAARAKFVAMVRAKSKGKKRNGTLLSDPPPVKKRRKSNRNPGIIRMTEQELSKFAGKIKGIGSSKPVRASRSVSAAPRKKRGAKFKKVGVFGGSGFLGLGRSRKTIKVNSKRKRNPSPAQVFSEFRGKDVSRKTKAKAAKGTPAVLAKLGQLRELRLRDKTLSFGGNASLAADGRKKLHVVGVQMNRPNPPGEVEYGEIISVTYRADKPHIESGTFDYVHKFGEDGGRRPKLVVDEEGFPLIEGGSYKIDSDGIID